MASARLPRQLLPLYAGTIATRMGTFVVPYLTLYLTLDRGLSAALTGTIIGAGGLGLLLGNIAGGTLADRLGRKPTLLLALTLNVIGIATLSVPLPSAAAYAVALGLASCGAGMYTPAATAWIADLTSPGNRARAFTVNYICINVGMGLGPLLGGVLATASFHWLFVGDVLSTLTCAAIIATARAQPLPPPAPKRRASGPSTPPRTTTMRPTGATLRLLGFCGLSFFIIAPLMGMEYAVPLLVGTVLREPLWLVGVVYSINAVCILALGLRVERLLKRRDPLTMMMLSGVLWAAGLALLKLGFSVPALLVSTVLWTLGEIVSSVVIPTYVSARAKASVRGRLLALPDAMRSLAAVIAPIALGVLWDRSGADAVLTVLVSTPAVGAALFVLAAPRLRDAPEVAT